VWLCPAGGARPPFPVSVDAAATVSRLCQLISQEERWDLYSVRVFTPACANLTSATPLHTVPTSPQQPLTYWCITPERSRIEVTPESIATLLRDIERSPRARGQIRRFGLVHVDCVTSGQSVRTRVMASDLDAYATRILGRPLAQIPAEADARGGPDPRPHREVVLARMWERVSLALTLTQKEFVIRTAAAMPFAVVTQALILADKDLNRCTEFLNQLRG
jgi:hypothetical protein